MSADSEPGKQSPAEQPRGRRPLVHCWRWLAAALAGLVIIALILALLAPLRRPELEPLPAIPEHLAAAAMRNLVGQKQFAVEQDMRSAKAWGELGSAFAHHCDQEALVCFRNAERLEPGNYRWPYLQGACHADRDPEQARRCFARAAQLAPNRPHVQLRLADFLLAEGELAGAQQAVERGLRAAPEAARAHLVQARVLFAKGDAEQARVWAENSVAMEPDKRETHVLLVQIYRRLSDAAAEQRELALAARLDDKPTSWDDPDVASVHALQDSARTAADSNKEQDAIQDTNTAMRLAQTLLKDGRNAEAEKIIRNQIRQFPDHERLHFQLGVACFQQDRYEEAALEFRRVIELKPDHSEAQYNLGHALWKLNRTEDARLAFAAAVRLRPGYAFARVNLAELLIAEGRLDEAREHLRVALQIEPHDRRAQQLLERAASTKEPAR